MQGPGMLTDLQALNQLHIEKCAQESACDEELLMLTAIIM